MSMGDSSGWQEPDPLPFAGLGEDLEPAELENWKSLKSGGPRLVSGYLIRG